MRNILSAILIISLLAQCTGRTVKNNSNDNKKDSLLKSGWYEIIEKDNGYERKLEKTKESFFIHPIPIITPSHITEVNILEIQESKKHNTILQFILDEEGQQKWNQNPDQTKDIKVGFIISGKLLDIQIKQAKENREWIQTVWDNNKYSRKEINDIKEAIENEMAIRIDKNKAIEIATKNASKAYRDLSIYKIIAVLKDRKWFVDFEIDNLQLAGGGPHYVISAHSGKILSLRYEQ